MLDATAERPTLDMEDTLARALLMQAETGLIALDPRHRIVLINTAARDLLGTPPGPIHGIALPTLLHAKSFPPKRSPPSGPGSTPFPTSRSISRSTPTASSPSPHRQAHRDTACSPSNASPAPPSRPPDAIP